METTILVIDDDLLVQDSLRIFLEDEGLTTFGCTTAEDALAFLQDDVADISLVVVDLRLPGIDGLTFIEQASSRWPELRYIIYTGSPELNIPPPIASLPQLSKTVFFKPLRDLSEMVRAIREILD